SPEHKSTFWCVDVCVMAGVAIPVVDGRVGRADIYSGAVVGIRHELQAEPIVDGLIQARLSPAKGGADLGGGVSLCRAGRSHYGNGRSTGDECQCGEDRCQTLAEFGDFGTMRLHRTSFHWFCRYTKERAATRDAWSYWLTSYQREFTLERIIE